VPAGDYLQLSVTYGLWTGCWDLVVTVLAVGYWTTISPVERFKIQIMFFNTYKNWDWVRTEQWTEGFLMCPGRCLE